MKEWVEERTIEVGQYIVENKATVRQTAKKFAVSKTTVHMDVKARLPLVRPILAKKANDVLQQNKAERSMRGGEAIRKKYLLLNSH